MGYLQNTKATTRSSALLVTRVFPLLAVQIHNISIILSSISVVRNLPIPNNSLQNPYPSLPPSFLTLSILFLALLTASSSHFRIVPLTLTTLQTVSLLPPLLSWETGSSLRQVKPAHTNL